MLPSNKHKTGRFVLVLCTLLSILTLSLLLTSCGGPAVYQDEKNDALPMEEANDSLSRYRIVRGDETGNSVLKAALNLRAAIRQRGGGPLSLLTDFSQSVPYEILIGPTNRPESLQVQKELDDTVQYIIRSVGDKIVLCANTQNDLYAAVERFTSECLKKSVSLTDIDILQANENLALCKKDMPCTVVVPDDASSEFVNCAEKMMQTLSLPEVRILHYKDYESGPAIMLGTIAEDTISVAYAAFLSENEYIARTAAEKVYLLGANDLLSLTALGDFLFDLQKQLDRDWEGNRCVSSPAAYSFNNTWDLYVPKPVQATLENSESISGSTHLFYYTGVTDYSLELFKQMLVFLGYSPAPYEENCYKEGIDIITFTFSPEDNTLGVTVTVEQAQSNIS